MKRIIYKLRARILISFVDWTKPIYAAVFKRHIRGWVYSRVDLLRMPVGSLGFNLGEFLTKHQFDLIPKMEDHDVLHVLLGFKTTVEDEVKMQFFLIGNRKKSVYAIMTVIAGCIIIPEFYKEYITAFKKGRRCHNISNWDFQHLLGEPIEVLKRQIHKQKCPRGPIIF